MTHPADIGAQVRRRRLAQGRTLEELAEASGVSPAMLSEVERSLKNPTLRVAYQIARALGASLSELMDDGDLGAAEVVRAAERRLLVDPETGVERYALSPAMQARGLELAQYVLPPRCRAGEMGANQPGILEHVTVLRGTLTLHLDERELVLRPGDGATYAPQQTVEYQNDGRSVCEFLLLSDSSRAR